MAIIEKELVELHDWELRQFLRKVLEEAHSTAEQRGIQASDEDPLLSKWGAFVESSRQRRLKEEESRNHIHLLFSLSDAGSLKVTLGNLGRRRESHVLAFDTLLSVGPIKELETEEGQRRRKEWLMERFPCHMHMDSMNLDNRMDRLVAFLTRLPEHQQITIYCSDNAHDQIGLRLAVYCLRHRHQPIHVVNMTQQFTAMASQYELPFHPYAIGHIPFDTLEQLLKKAVTLPPLTEEQRSQYELDWRSWSEQEGTLRLWLNGAVQSVPEHYYDENLIEIVDRLQLAETKSSYVRAGRVVGEAIEGWGQLIGDSFVDYRLWTLISDGKLEFRGLPGALYRYSVKVRD